jgi:hypothetical protein
LETTSVSVGNTYQTRRIFYDSVQTSSLESTLATSPPSVDFNGLTGKLNPLESILTKKLGGGGGYWSPEVVPSSHLSWIDCRPEHHARGLVSSFALWIQVASAKRDERLKESPGVSNSN